MSAIANTHFDKASELFRQGRPDDAIKELKNGIEADPGHIKSYVALAGLYESRKQFDLAIDVYRKVVQRDMDNAWANLRLGSLLSQIGRYDDALTPLRMAWSNDRSSARTACALARALDETGDQATAQIMYEEAIRLNPDLGEPLFNLATLRFNAQNYQSAIALYTTYMLKAGDSGPAFRNIGKACLELGHTDAAIRNFEKSIAIIPDDSTAFLNMGLAYTLKDDYEKAKENYERALEIDPTSTEARYNLAKALRLQGKLVASAVEFQTVLTQQPNHYRSMNGLANCYLIQRDYTSALGILRQAIAIAPDYDLAHYNLGVALQNLNQIEEAAYHFKEAERLNALEQASYSAADHIMKRSGLNPPHRKNANPTIRLLAA